VVQQSDCFLDSMTLKIKHGSSLKHQNYSTSSAVPRFDKRHGAMRQIVNKCHCHIPGNYSAMAQQCHIPYNYSNNGTAQCHIPHNYSNNGTAQCHILNNLKQWHSTVPHPKLLPNVRTQESYNSSTGPRLSAGTSRTPEASVPSNCDIALRGLEV
jgi:hypothetical protein